MAIWFYNRKMKQFQGEETAENSKHFEIVKIIEVDSPGSISDKYEVLDQFLTENEAKDKVAELSK